MKKSVLIIKKERLSAVFMSEWLEERHFEIIGTTDNTDEAISLTKCYLPSIVIVDKNLIGGDGIETARIIKKNSPGTHCVICIDEKDDLSETQCKYINLSGYIYSTHKLVELIECIDYIYEGYTYISPYILKNQTKYNPSYNENNLKNLSKTEKKVLLLIGDSKSNQEIANELFISINTVNNHKANIKKKLDFKHNQDLLISLKSVINLMINSK